MQALVLAPPQVRIQTAVCLRHIAQHDYPDHWPTLLPGLIACIQSPNPTQIYGGLLGLRSLVEKYEFKPRDQGREPLDQIVQVLSHARCCKRTPFRKTEGAREKGSDAARELGREAICIRDSRLAKGTAQLGRDGTAASCVRCCGARRMWRISLWRECVRSRSRSPFCTSY